jgi:protein gp37
MTWNPVTGCTMISPGCARCYAERMSRRLKAMGSPNYRNGFALTLQPHTLEYPLKWKKPLTIFVNSMSDLLHESVPFDYIQRVFEVMNKANWHTFQILTKRSDRLLELSPRLDWREHVWMGVSVESAKYAYRVDHLRKTEAKVKFLSVEPLLGPIPKLKLKDIDWVIVGGESGPGARRIEPAWVMDIRDQCVRANVAFFFKQWGGVNKKKSGRELGGRLWNEMPQNASSKRALVVLS